MKKSIYIIKPNFFSDIHQTSKFVKNQKEIFLNPDIRHSYTSILLQHEQTIDQLSYYLWTYKKLDGLCTRSDSVKKEENPKLEQTESGQIKEYVSNLKKNSQKLELVFENCVIVL